MVNLEVMFANKSVVFVDRDPSWMNVFVKNKVKWKSEMYKTYIKNGFTENSYIELQDPTNAVTEVINTRKQ